MPGIIPMKLIKCGSTQTRIAQACDRCRSKKIRCDGVRPCCSQCANVGFECKTSDKLSRRAFPRGYTESLEERVRSLEREVRELKDLLDAKDEQLEMVSKINSFSPYSPPASTSSGMSRGMRKSPESIDSRRAASIDGDEVLVVGESLRKLVTGKGEGGLYVGASSGSVFIDDVKERMLETGLEVASVPTEAFFERQTNITVTDPQLRADSLKAPPRLLSDHLLVSYFQEYHPLFPVLHRPTFLSTYEKLVAADEEAAQSLSRHDIARLFLVFSISLQNESKSSTDRQSFDAQWQRALEHVISDTSVDTLQCLVLAQLYCFVRNDQSMLLHYKSLAIGISIQLGLNRSQRKFKLGPLAGELRKRAFWCVYCLDAFSAAMLGLPKMLKDEDIDAEYPSDIDDEYVSEDGFLATLPGDSTKISSALALFRVSRVLSLVLTVEYSASTADELTFAKLRELEEDLDSWKAGLAPHLRMEFVNGAPATHIVHSRSPLLVFAYHYIRTLIYRPAIGSNLPHRSGSALITLRESSKCITQILELLSERGLAFSFCLSKAHVLLLAGFSFVYSAIELQRDGVLAKENQKLTVSVVSHLRKTSPRFARNFVSIASTIINCREDTKQGISNLPEIPDPKPPQRLSLSHARSSNSLHNQVVPSLDIAASNLADYSPPQPQPPPHRTRSLHESQHVAKLLSRPVSYDPNVYDGYWPLESQREQTPVAQDPEEWERMLALLDANHAAHIYGEVSGESLMGPPSSFPVYDSWAV